MMQNFKLTIMYGLMIESVNNGLLKKMVVNININALMEIQGKQMQKKLV